MQILWNIADLITNFLLNYSLLILAAFFFYLSFSSVHRGLAFKKGAIRLQGIVHMIEKVSDENGVWYLHTYEIINPNDGTKQLTSPHSEKIERLVGDKVGILYNKNNFHNIIVEEGELWNGPTFFIIMTTIILGYYFLK